MAKVLCVLYDDPVDGYPKNYARDDIPKIDHYPDGQTTPTPTAIDFKPGQLLGSVSGELGLRKFLEKAGHTLVVTSDKDGPNSTFEKELPIAAICVGVINRRGSSIQTPSSELGCKFTGQNDRC